MTRAWELLGEITGDSYQDELLDQLFSQFCLGRIFDPTIEKRSDMFF